MFHISVNNLCCIKLTIVPIIGNVLVVPTVEVSIERNHRAGAHIVVGSLDLKVATELPNGELGSSLTTGSGRCGQNINTRDNGLQDTGLLLGQFNIRSNPIESGESQSRYFVISTFFRNFHIIIRNRNQGSSVTLTNHIVARNHESRSIADCHRKNSFVFSAAFKVGVRNNHFHKMGADLVITKRGGEVLTGHTGIHTIQVPGIDGLTQIRGSGFFLVFTSRNTIRITSSFSFSFSFSDLSLEGDHLVHAEVRIFYLNLSLLIRNNDSELNVNFRNFDLSRSSFPNSIRIASGRSIDTHNTNFRPSQKISVVNSKFTSGSGGNKLELRSILFGSVLFSLSFFIASLGF